VPLLDAVVRRDIGGIYSVRENARDNVKEKSIFKESGQMTVEAVYRVMKV
jgi:hypothetical protein